MLDAPAGACTYVYVFARVARAFTVCIIMYPEKSEHLAPRIIAYSITHRQLGEAFSESTLPERGFAGSVEC